ncbi:MAG: cation diffusion facilitator family transporter [Syntrophothermus sp.]
MKSDSLKANREKNLVALSSVLAAILLTLFKLIVGFSTNSLGILSEAAHSGLDLIAALVTLFAVKMAAKPADEDHHFGHGKTENLSALFETVLLLITCGWIILEVYERLTTKRVHVEVTAWSYIVVVVSIIIDISRSRALSKTAKKYNSQALEADALHFSSDIYSSLVVLIGLISYSYGFVYADSIAALIVAVIVIMISIRLGKRTIDVLMDKAPGGLKEKIETIARSIPEVLEVHDIKIRNSGADILVEMNIHVNSGMTINRAHEISHMVEDQIQSSISNTRVIVHTEPDSYTADV